MATPFPGPPFLKPCLLMSQRAFFFHGNEKKDTVLSMRTHGHRPQCQSELVQDNSTGPRCKIERAPQILQGPGIFAVLTSLKFQFNSCIHRRDMQGIWHPNYLCGGILICVPPPPLQPCKLYATRTEMLGKAIWRRRIQENPSVAGALLGPGWGSLQRSRKPPSWWGGAGCPLPRTPSTRCRPSPLLPPLQN